ncbi:MAG: transglutaminase family protein [Planctomycetota bacterium]
MTLNSVGKHRWILVTLWFWTLTLNAGEATLVIKTDGPLFECVLELNRVQEPDLDLAATRTAFKELLAQAKTVLIKATTPREKVAALCQVVLDRREVLPLSNKYWRDSTLAASLLRRKGNCLSVATLLVLAGEELNLPIRLVVVPRHVFARWDDGQTRINIETINKGSEIPDEVYLYRHAQAAPDDIEALGWGKSLSKDGFWAELLEAAAGGRASENRLENALALLTQAEKLAPYRTDMKLRRLMLEADVTGKRPEARQKIQELLTQREQPPSVVCSALFWAAGEFSAAGDYETERRLLLSAFSRAPKSSEAELLQRLAFCLRNLKDYRGAARYMELATTLILENSPDYVNVLYNLAIMMKNDKRLDEALTIIRAALKKSSESWNLQMLEAGYMIMNNQREDGLKRFEKIERPRSDLEAYEGMLAWFYAVSHQREKFYSQLDRALALSQSPHILIWIEQDIDLDVYRNEPEFKALVEKHRQRILPKVGSRLPPDVPVK